MKLIKFYKKFNNTSAINLMTISNGNVTKDAMRTAISNSDDCVFTLEKAKRDIQHYV